MQQPEKDKSNAPTSKSRNDNDFSLKIKLGRRPSFKRTRPMLQHPSPETSFNQQTISVYERPASMKKWRPETMLSQDCSLDCRGTRKWRVQCPIPQVQKHYNLLLKMELGRRPSFKRTSPMLFSLKRQVQCSNIRVQNQWWFLVKSEAGPKAQLQKDKSNAPTSKSRNNNDFLSKMKLGRRPSFKRTSPMLQHQVQTW